MKTFVKKHKNGLTGTDPFGNSTAHVTLIIRSRSPKLCHLFTRSQCCIQVHVSLKNNSPFSSGGRLGFIEFQNAKLTKK